MDRELLANGSPLLNVTAAGTNTAKAQSGAYGAVDKVDFKSGFCRRILAEVKLNARKVGAFRK